MAMKIERLEITCAQLAEGYVDNEEDNTTTYSSFKDKPNYRRGSSLF